jgi:3D (Asp-Asp-Asp) domain-containing protein
MRSKLLLIALSLALLLAVALRPSPLQEPPPPGPVVRIIPPPVEQTAPEPEEAAVASAEVHVIEECTVTWYTADTCGKAPDHPAYGITASGLPVEEGVTCAVDPAVIPLGSEVRVLYADGSAGTFRATDTGVKGEWVDIYTPSYDYAVQCGLQRLTVYWTGPEE